MTTNVFGCWYDPGDAGTWLTWFINQHKNFPKFNKSIRYEQADNTFGNIPTDYSCFDSDWHVTDWSDNKTTQFNDVNAFKGYDNVCYKILPWHNPFQVDDDELENETQEELCIRLLKDSNTKLIITPQVEISYQIFAKRLAFIRPRFTVEQCISSYKNRMRRSYNNTLTEMRKHIPVHVVAIDKLILRNDVDEYNKLIDVLDIPAMDNWTTHTNHYYTSIFAPLTLIDSDSLNNRPETLERSGGAPY